MRTQTCAMDGSCGNSNGTYLEGGSQNPAGVSAQAGLGGSGQARMRGRNQAQSCLIAANETG